MKTYRTKIRFLVILLTTAAYIACPSHAADGAAREVDKYENATVFVESFLVQCDLEALYAAGVSPIGAGGGSVTVEHVLQCFKGGKAHVITGAKLAMRHRSQSQVEWQVREYIGREHQSHVKTGPGETTPVRETRFEPFQSNLNFEASVNVASEAAIRTNFTFRHSGFEASGEGAPPATFDRRWSDNLVLTHGTPTIVGATQNKENVVFLILTARIAQ